MDKLSRSGIFGLVETNLLRENQRLFTYTINTIIIKWR